MVTNALSLMRVIETLGESIDLNGNETSAQAEWVLSLCTALSRRPESPLQGGSRGFESLNAHARNG
jgi:hypothetical protein